MVAVLSGLRAEGLPLAKLARAAGMAAASGSSSSRRSRRGSAACAVQLRMRGADLQQPALAPASVLTENSASWRVRSGQASVSGPHDSCTGATACNSLSVLLRLLQMQRRVCGSGPFCSCRVAFVYRPTQGASPAA